MDVVPLGDGALAQDPSTPLAPEMALLDTGAQTTILSGEWLRNNLDLGVLGPPGDKVYSRYGAQRGHHVPCRFKLLSDLAGGEDLAWEGSAWVSPDWIGPTIMGVRGALDRMRFHLDPLSQEVSFARM